MSSKLVGWAWEQDAGSPTRKLVLVALADHANGHTGECFPNIQRIADETELSYRTVQRALADLEESGLISRDRQRRENGSLGGYVYTFPLQDSLSGSPPDTLTSRPPDTVTGVREEPEEVQPEVPPVVPRIVSIWKLYSPPLIDHRDSYFAEQTTRRAIERALRVYPVEAVANAIFNYATVLGSDDYRWDYRWTIIDFLKRGLDRFVDEALPLENFKIRKDGTKFGRRDVSAAEMLAAADRLEAEEGKQWGQLESG